MEDLHSTLGPFLPVGFPVNESQWQSLALHFRLLQKWNQTMNLTAIRDPEQMLARHFGESLLLIPHLHSYTPGSRIIDIGSGAGFPGVPLAITLPHLHFTLLDSHARKCVFLREVTRALSNVRVLNKRIESVGESFDVAVSRGVAWSSMAKHLPHLCKSLHFLSTDDDWLEIRKDPNWDWRPPVPLPTGSRHLIISATVSRGTA